MSDAEFLRLRARGMGEGDERPRRVPAGPPAFVGRVVSTSNGLAGGVFVKVNPVTEGGTEAEGGTAAAAADTSRSLLVYLLDGTVATGDDLVCGWVPFRWVARKKAGTSGCAVVEATVGGCNNIGVPNATVTLTLGATTVTGTTDSAGHCTLTLPTAGTWSFSFVASRLVTFSSSVVITCRAPHFFIANGIAMTAATGYICTNLCPNPTPTALTLADGINPALALAYDTGTFGAWIGKVLRTVTCPTVSCAGSFGTTGSTPVIYIFNPSGVLQVAMPVADTDGDGIPDRVVTGMTIAQLNFFLGGGGSGCLYFDNNGGSLQASTLDPTAAASDCTPGSQAFARTFTTEGSAAIATFAAIYGAGTSATLTVSE